MILASVKISTLPMARLLFEEQIVPAEAVVYRYEAPMIGNPLPEEQPMVVDHSQVPGPQVEGWVSSEEPVSFMTREVVPESIVSTEVEPAHHEGPPSPRATIKELTTPLGESILEENLNEPTSPKEPSLNIQQARDVEMQPAESTPEQASDEPERPVPLIEPAKAEPMEVEEEAQRV